MRNYLLLFLMLNASTAFGEIYTWKDSRGTEYYTNSLDEIPARYLKKARVLDVATGKKGGLATEHAASQPAPHPGGTGQGVAQPVPAPAPMPVPASPVGSTPAVIPAPPALPQNLPSVSVPQGRGREPGQRRTQRRRDLNPTDEE